MAKWQTSVTHLLPGPALLRAGPSSPGEALSSWVTAREPTPGGAEAAGWVSPGTQLPAWAQSFAASQPAPGLDPCGWVLGPRASPAWWGVGPLHGTSPSRIGISHPFCGRYFWASLGSSMEPG